MPCGHVRREIVATTAVSKGSEEPCSSKAEKNRKKRLRKKRSKLRALTDRTVSSCASELEVCGTSLPFPEEKCSSRSPAEIGHGIPVEELSAQSQPTCSFEMDEETFDYGVVSAHSLAQSIHPWQLSSILRIQLGGAFDQDPRLSVLEKGWFHKKRCLDIGCNEGLVTLSLAKTFGTTSMTGIDLDEHLIKRACAHLKEERSAAINEFVLSQQAGTDASTRKIVRRKMQSLAQTWFLHGNVLASRIDKGSFDCITAFSVTKWIHLHGGDAGIRYFFSKIRDLLAPGGRFIVEPQSWKSYKSAANKMKRHKLGSFSKHVDNGYFFRLDEIKIRPEDFCTILPEEYGLKFVRQLCPPTDAAEGFDREILMFQKL
eukprot:jgi/Picre1/35783/NNA_003243.t1